MDIADLDIKSANGNSIFQLNNFDEKIRLLKGNEKKNIKETKNNKDYK